MNNAQPEPSDQSKADPADAAPDEGARRKRRPETRGARSSDRHRGGESNEKEKPSSRRGHRSESRGERSDDRHSHSHHESRSRGRAQRGDVRAAVLVLLAEQPMHGYQLMHTIAERTKGAWRPSPGAIYPTIAQLEDENLVSVVSGAGRKLVTLTETGSDYMTANQDTMVDPFTAITSQAGGSNDLRGSVEEIYAATRAVGKSGNDAQIAEAQQILSQARRDLYMILAEPPSKP